MNLKNSPKDSKKQIVLYKNRLEVKLDQNTIWLRQEQIATLFGTKRPAITKHLKNIFKSGELNEKVVGSILEHTTPHGAIKGKTQKKAVKHYNLDVIIAVGYRVNSKQATQFRIWATNILKKHLIDGYTLNKNRLKMVEYKYLELQKSLKLLENVISLENIPNETKGLIAVISQYSKALDILDDYDNNRLSFPKGTKKLKYTFNYEDAKLIIEEMKKKFKSSSLFGKEKDKSFKSSLRTIYQTFNNKDVYPTVEEKSANLLYFIVKNHSFVDGNKRIAAALFVCFLQKNGILLRKDGTHRIDNNSLVALTLMIATSKPPEKEILLKVILNLLA
ncbi:MAG: virulence protein RhuM/Fic/DOC family protein [Elusimicrobiota bacterium]|nr:virulence protein RhuM/Fic/DOC family protein [Elusimicrobiota bacterium]